MEKILEVLRYGDCDIRFNTDIDPLKKPDEIPLIISQTAFAMATKLWGGNEQAVLAMIRSLSIADLSMSVNRKEMIRHLDIESERFFRVFAQAKKDFEMNGGKILSIGPGVMPPKNKS